MGATSATQPLVPRMIRAVNIGLWGLLGLLGGLALGVVVLAAALLIHSLTWSRSSDA